MRKSKFTQQQIIDIIGEQEKGLTVTEVSRKHGISSATFFKWKAKVGAKKHSAGDNYKAPDARSMRDIEIENSQLRKLLVDAMLEISALRGSQGKKSA